MRPQWLLAILVLSIDLCAGQGYEYRLIEGPEAARQLSIDTNTVAREENGQGRINSFPRIDLVDLAEPEDHSNSTSSPSIVKSEVQHSRLHFKPLINTNSAFERPLFVPHPTRSTVDATFPPLLHSPPRSRAMRMKKAKDGVKIALAKSASSPSHRLQNDILIVPPPKGSRLYVLVLISIHEASEHAWKGYECGRVNLDGFVKLTAFLHALKEANSSPLLSSTLSLGAVVVDTCSSDLRTIADLYELLAGSEISKSDLVAVIRDDDSHLPNVDLFVSQLGLPVIYAYPERGQSPSSPLPIDVTPISTASPLQGPALNGLLVALKQTNSSCFSLLYDAPHKSLISPIRTIADRLEMCIEERIQIDLDDNNADLAIRRLLLTESRAVLVLLSQPQWKQLLRALREELVIADRFAILSPSHSGWSSSRGFKQAWPYFDQVLITATREIDEEEQQLREERLTVLAKNLPDFPFQKSWIRHFWATAYECHMEGEAVVPGEQQFSRPCSSLQSSLNFSSIAPTVDILPLERAVEALATALRRLVDSLCPGANLTSILDCTNQPASSLSSSLHSLEFVHSLTRSLAPPLSAPMPFNHRNRTVFFDRRMKIRRFGFSEGEMYFTEMGLYDETSERLFTTRPLSIRERDGAESVLHSVCPSCPCSSLRQSRYRPPPPPSISSSLRSPSLLAVSIVALLLSLLSLLGIYHQLLSEDAFRVCGMFSYAGLTCLCTLSPFFVLQSSPLACSVRRFGLSTCIAAIYAPVFVETTFLATRRYSPSGSNLFWLSAAIVGVQAVMVGEWSLFESSSSIAFVTGGRPDESGAWRCAPGASFESRLLLSATIPASLIPLSLILALCRARWMRPLTSLLTLHLAAFYLLAAVGLPLVAFERRDIVFAVGLLAFALTHLFVSLFRARELSPIEDDADTLPRKGKGGYGNGLMRIGGPLDTRARIRRMDGTMGSVDGNEDDERKFNEAMAAASKGNTIERFNSKLGAGGHVFFINQNTGALTARQFREPTPLIDYPMDDKYIYAETMKRREPETLLRPTERLFINTNTKPPRPTKRSSVPENSPSPPPINDRSIDNRTMPFGGSIDARTLPMEGSIDERTLPMGASIEARSMLSEDPPETETTDNIVQDQPGDNDSFVFENERF